MASNGHKLIVVAIDFGSTYSGYAFSTIDDFRKDPVQNIKTNQAWNAGGQALLSLKTPTCLLLDPRKNRCYFGYDAQNMYIEYTDKNEQDHVYYFSLFKMKLGEGKCITDDFELEEEIGKKLKAIDVFATSIRLLKEHFMRTIANRGIPIRSEEVQWVLTVPAIWPAEAKLFMRKAAEKGGIPGNCLKIALEPEAASLFCQHAPKDKMLGSDQTFSVSKKGTRYMVVDLGGGTVDITVHKKLANKKLKELYKATGGPWGGAAVNEEFFKLLLKIVGGRALHTFRTKHTSDYLDIIREFEVTKRRVGGQALHYTIKIPATLNICCQAENDETINQIVASDNFPYKADVRAVYDKLRLTPVAMMNLFKPVVDEIVNHLKQLVSKEECKGLSKILLVGGFSECTIIQDVVRQNFETDTLKVFIPHEAGLAVLKGAVIFGHTPDAIESRIARFTYGLSALKPFNPRLHSIDRRVIAKDGLELAANCFSPMVRVGDVVEVGKVVKDDTASVEPYRRGVIINVYSSTERSPVTVMDPGCQKIWSWKIDFTEMKTTRTELEITYEFGDSEIHMTAREKGTRRLCSASFEME